MALAAVYSKYMICQCSIVSSKVSQDETMTSIELSMNHFVPAAYFFWLRSAVILRVHPVVLHLTDYQESWAAYEIAVEARG